ncbi:S8 family serine peptidase [Actinomadura sp. 21ATH]|uniref:S8 family serine peptidase n=1 Tax=Actinomadura sp. 21ATH TaxID=1735444 RepID=UPI0035BF6C29
MKGRRGHLRARWGTPTALKRLAATCATTTLILGYGHPVSAAPSPRPDQWWFPAWEIEEKVWPLSKGRGVTVAVLDSGAEARLPELRGVVLKGKQLAGARGDGRQDIDTEKGGHGTAMAVAIAGQGGGTGLVGIAPETRILPVVGGTFFYEKQIHYAVDRGAKVINLALSTPGTECPPRTQDAINYAIEHDVVIVTGAGNLAIAKSSEYYPPNCAGVLTVGALDADMNAWKKTTPGSTVMAAAPGVSVGVASKYGTYRKTNGTSFATALTSGLVALIRSRYPEMSGREVVQRLLYTARDVDTKGWDERTGYGALIPYTALTAKIPPNAPNPVYERFDRLAKAGPRTTLSARAVNPKPRIEQGSNGTIWPPVLAVIGTLFVAAASGILYLRRARPGSC